MDSGVLGTLFIALVVLQLTTLVAYHRGNRNLGLIYVFAPVAAVLVGVIGLGLLAAGREPTFGYGVAILGIWLIAVWLFAVRRTWARANAGASIDVDGAAALDQEVLVAETIVPVLAAVLGVAALLVWAVTLTE
jgi:hypothetical protein